MVGKTLHILLFTTLLGCAACSTANTDDRLTAMPRPVAWPRLPLPAADSLTIVDDLPLTVMVNTAADIERSGDTYPALTVTYPGLNAGIYWTFIPAKDNLDQIIDARRQRISLNLNGTPADTHHTAPDAAAEGVLVTAQSGSLTPVQLLVVSPDGTVVTATAFLADPRAAEAYDSIRPLIDMLQRDMSRALPDAPFQIP